MPLTLLVNRNIGIENENLSNIIFRDKCLPKYRLPYLDENGNIEAIYRPGEYFVFDLIDHNDVVHELFCYIITNLPRVHTVK